MSEPEFETKVIKARIGNVVVKRVGSTWHVYELGPMTEHATFEEAVEHARTLAGMPFSTREPEHSTDRVFEE